MLGQASLIDILFLGTIVSISSVVMMPSSVSIDDTMYPESLMMSVMNSGDNLTVADKLALSLCNNENNNVESEIKTKIESVLDSDYNYIFYAASYDKEIHLFDSQDKVCMKSISLSTIDIISCPMIQQPTLGVWHKSEKPRRECDE